MMILRTEQGITDRDVQVSLIGPLKTITTKVSMYNAIIYGLQVENHPGYFIPEGSLVIPNVW
jgi:hypothetical protein